MNSLLNNPNPVVTEVVAAKSYDKLHVYSLTVVQPSANPLDGSITVQLIPATSDGELGAGEQVQRLTAPLNEQIMLAVPELRAAFESVVNAIVPTQNYIANQAAGD